MPRTASQVIRSLKSRSLIAAVLLSLFATAAFEIWAAELPHRQEAVSQLVAHTLEVLAAASRLDAHLEALAGDADRPARPVAAIARDIAALRELTTDNLAQSAAIDRLNELIGIRGGWSMQEIDQALTLADVIKVEERRLLADRQIEAAAALRRSVAALTVCGSLLAGIGFCALFVLAEPRRQRHLAALSQRNADLEVRVALGTAELASSRARQHSYFHSSTAGKIVMLATADGIWVHEDLNETFIAITGRRREDIIGRPLGEVWPEPIACGAARRLDACVARRWTLHYAGTHEFGGARRDIDVMLMPLLDQVGDVRRVLATVRDVTKRRELQRQVKRNAELRADAAEREVAVFRNSADILFVVRVEQAGTTNAFFFEAFNPMLAIATGWQPQDLIGHGPDQTLPPEQAKIALATYRRCVAEGTTISYTATYQTPLGPRDFDGSLTPIRQAAGGQVIRLIGGLRDVTERNRMQAALYQTQKMEAIGRLAAGVAHDFNNILQSIFSSLEMVLDGVQPATPIHEFVSAGLRSAARGSSLTQHLLSFARKQVLRPRAVELASLLADLRSLLTPTLGPHITIRLEIDPAAPAVQADPGQLQTALLNLAINASHAMPQGGLLTIAVRPEMEASQRRVAIVVTDTGTGMDTETLAKAMDPFFTTKGVGGTGLGLSMVQGFAAQSGGRLSMSSRLGEGTSVAICLPAAAAAETADAPRISHGVPAGTRILLIDDDQDAIVAMGAFLDAAGFKVTRAQNAGEALVLLAADRDVEAIVTDYAMPGVNGADLISQARLLRPGLPAVLISGFIDISDAATITDGALTLRKPFQRQQLINAIEQVMDARRAHHTHAAV